MSFLGLVWIWVVYRPIGQSWQLFPPYQPRLPTNVFSPAFIISIYRSLVWSGKKMNRNEPLSRSYLNTVVSRTSLDKFIISFVRKRIEKEKNQINHIIVKIIQLKLQYNVHLIDYMKCTFQADNNFQEPLLWNLKLSLGCAGGGGAVKL